MYVYIDMRKKESVSATDLKALSEATGINYHTLVYYLRGRDYYQQHYWFIVVRIREHHKSKRKFNVKSKDSF
jgi:hypothetical protein